MSSPEYLHEYPTHLLQLLYLCQYSPRCWNKMIQRLSGIVCKAVGRTLTCCLFSISSFMRIPRQRRVSWKVCLSALSMRTLWKAPTTPPHRNTIVLDSSLRRSTQSRRKYTFFYWCSFSRKEKKNSGGKSSRLAVGGLPVRSHPGCVEVSLSKTPSPQLLLTSWLMSCMAANRCLCVSVCEWVNEKHQLYSALDKGAI